MKISLANLKKLNPKGIFQGDMMYSRSDLQKSNIDGQSYITFHPNTIMYAVPQGSNLAKQITSSKMGIVLHTEYTGNTWDSLSASYNVSKKSFTQTSSVWFDDANVKDLTGQASFTKKETAELTKHLSNAGKMFQRIAGSTLRELENHELMARELETYNNKLVRGGKIIPANTRGHVDGLIKHINDKYQNKIDKLKTEKGKKRKRDEMDVFMAFFSKKNKKSLQALYELQRSLIFAKLMVVSKLNQINNMKTFLKTKNGFQVTGHEGFVAINSGNAFKLVDQLEFSHANFSDEILKGWENPG
jgi:hypothetical protein